MSYLLPYSLLCQGANETHQAYLDAKPFPHGIIDGLIPEAVLRAVLEEFPSPDSDYWKQPDTEHTQGKQVVNVPVGQFKDQSLGPVTRQLLWELQAEPFLYFLRMLTGIEGLVGDPYLVEGGLHQIKPGGFLDAHADFSHHHYTGLQRRVNVLIYLNEGWQEEYGGILKLYSRDGQAVQQIIPDANRTVIFSTSETSFHGHPEPLTCPPDRTRKSIALYYYTAPTGEPSHRAIFLNTLREEVTA